MRLCAPAVLWFSTVFLVSSFLTSVPVSVLSYFVRLRFVRFVIVLIFHFEFSSAVVLKKILFLDYFLSDSVSSCHGPGVRSPCRRQRVTWLIFSTGLWFRWSSGAGQRRVGLALCTSFYSARYFIVPGGGSNPIISIFSRNSIFFFIFCLL